MSSQAVVIWRLHWLDIQNGSLAWLSVDPGFHLETPLVTGVPTAIDWSAYTKPSHCGDLRAVQLCKLWLISPRTSIPREPGKCCMVTYYLASEFTQSNWCCTTLMETVARSIRFKGKEHRTSLSMGEVWMNVEIKLENNDIKEKRTMTHANGC